MVATPEHYSKSRCFELLPHHHARSRSCRSAYGRLAGISDDRRTIPGSLMRLGGRHDRVAVILKLTPRMNTQPKSAGTNPTRAWYSSNMLPARQPPDSGSRHIGRKGRVWTFVPKYIDYLVQSLLPV
jgi:hypothetical protein